MATKIMIVDDEPDIRLYLMSVLNDNGYSTCTLADDASVTASVKREAPDLILLDILMPKRSGISLYRELRSEPTLSGIPIAFFSGMELEHNFDQEGFRKLIGDDAIPPPDGFIPKPIRIEVLLKAVRTLLEATAR